MSEEEPPVDMYQDDSVRHLPPVKDDRSSDRLPQKSPAKLSLVRALRKPEAPSEGLGLQPEAEMKWLTEFIADVFRERPQKCEKLLERHRIGRLLATETFIKCQLNDNLPRRRGRNQSVDIDCFDKMVDSNSEDGPCSSKHSGPAYFETAELNATRSTHCLPEYMFTSLRNDLGCAADTRRVTSHFDQSQTSQQGCQEHQSQWKTKSQFSREQVRREQKWRVLSMKRTTNYENDFFECESNDTDLSNTDTKYRHSDFTHADLLGKTVNETTVKISKRKSAKFEKEGVKFGTYIKIIRHNCHTFRKCPISDSTSMSAFLKRKGRDIDKEFFHLITPLKRRRIQQC